MPAARRTDEKAPRAMRADAQRNRDAILATARETFESEGVMASLDAIALRAGVGNATLYRNFPTREDLQAAVFRTGIDTALSDADERAPSLGPREALAEWLVQLTWQLRMWQDLPTCVATGRSDHDSSMRAATDPLLARTAALLEAAQAAGEAVDGVTADELFELVTALSWGIDRFGTDADAARRRVGLATAGIFT